MISPESGADTCLKNFKSLDKGSWWIVKVCNVFFPFGVNASFVTSTAGISIIGE